MNADENREEKDNKKTENIPLKSGRSLERWIHTFLSTLSDKTIKCDSITKDHLVVFIFRSKPFENLITELKKISVTGTLAHQHDVIKVFLNDIHLKSQFSALEQRNFEGIKIDITHLETTYELKTRRNVSASDIKTFIADHFNTMKKMRQTKHCWWLVYFMKRTDEKAKKGRVCMYYLVLIEINVQDYQDLESSFEKIVEDVKQMVESVKRSVVKKDEVDDPGILVPVENILIVDSLREEVQEITTQLHEKDVEMKKKLQEKDAQIELLQDELKKLQK
jgi:hypothetical protein